MTDPDSGTRWTRVGFRRSVPTEPIGSEAGACFAPHAGVYFQPDGIVRPCCTTANQWGRLGGHDGATLTSILRGERADAHRAALDAGDFSLGCWECEIPARQGRREASLAVHFDRFAETTPSPYPKLMDFALSNRCNLQCVMCNGELSSAIRSQRDHLPPLPAVYDDAFFAELRDYLPHLERAQFKGGEPFLSRETERVWDLLLELEVDCEVSVTTNGTIWNDRVERYLRDLRMHAIVSVDGMTAATFEAVRVGAHFDQVWANIDRIEAVTTETGEKMTLSFCLMPANHHELGAFLRETQRRGCNPNVILVNQPAEHDLTQLPVDELHAVLTELDREDRNLRDELHDRYLEEWQTTLGRLQDHVRDPVRLWGPGRDPHDADLVAPLGHRPLRADPDAVRRELEAWAGLPALIMVAEDATITSVDVPRWADELAPETWVGKSVDAAGRHLAALFGTEPVSEARGRDDGAVQISASYSSETVGGSRVFRVLICTVEAGSGRTRQVHLIAPDPMSSSG